MTKQEKVKRFSRSTPPYFPLYVGDLLSSNAVRAMNAEEFGIYMFLLCADWQGPGLDFNPDNLARSCQTTVEKFQAAWDRIVGGCFEVAGDGRYYNPRLKLERRHAAAVSRVRSKAAKAPRVKASAEQLLNRSESHAAIPEPDPEPDPTPLRTSPSSSRTRLLSHWDTPSDQAEVAAFLNRTPKPDKWADVMSMFLDGGRHIQPTPVQMLEAVRHFEQNGAEPNASHFEGYLKRACLPDKPAVQSQGNESFRVLTEIRGLVQHNGQRSFIAADKVRALGDVAWRAYQSIGGADRVIGVTADKLSYLIRDFEKAFEAARVTRGGEPTKAGESYTLRQFLPVPSEG